MNTYKMKTMIMTSIFIGIMFLTLMICTGPSFAETAAAGGTAGTAEELNAALGGNHMVDGDTVVLQDDVMIPQDVSVSVENTSSAVTLDANGKSVTVSGELVLTGAELIITGSGSFIAAAESGAGHVMSVQKGSRLTVENGTFTASGAPVIYIGALSDGSNTPERVTVNGGDLGDYSINAVDYGTLALTVNGGNVGEVRTGFNNTAKHVIAVNGGVVDKIEPYNSKIIVNGGQIGAGGVVTGDLGGSFDLQVKSGRINGPVKGGGKLTMTGGAIVNKGCSVGAFIMKGGTISSSGSYGVVAYSGKTACVMSGGIIKTTKKGAKGIVLKYKKKLTVTGGVIKGNSGMGIYVKGGSRKQIATLIFKGVKGRKAVIKGYASAVAGKKGYSKISLKTHTVVRAPKMRKSAYYRGQKLPRIFKGNLTSKYTAVRSK